MKPRSADINENVLSESTKEELGLCEDLIRKGQSLDQVVSQVKNKLFAFFLSGPKLTDFGASLPVSVFVADV